MFLWKEDEDATRTSTWSEMHSWNTQLDECFSYFKHVFYAEIPQNPARRIKHYNTYDQFSHSRWSNSRMFVCDTIGIDFPHWGSNLEANCPPTISKNAYSTANFPVSRSVWGLLMKTTAYRWSKQRAKNRPLEIDARTLQLTASFRSVPEIWVSCLGWTCDLCS